MRNRMKNVGKERSFKINQLKRCFIVVKSSKIFVKNYHKYKRKANQSTFFLEKQYGNVFCDTLFKYMFSIPKSNIFPLSYIQPHILVTVHW